MCRQRFFCLFVCLIQRTKFKCELCIHLIDVLIETSYICLYMYFYLCICMYVYIFVCMYISHVICLFAVFLVDAYHCCNTLVTLVKPWHSRILWKSFLWFLFSILNRNISPKYVLNSEVSVLRLHVENMTVFSFPQDRSVT